MRKTAILKNDLFLEHIPDFNHVECPDRLRVIYEELEQQPLKDIFLFPEFEPASQNILAFNHTPDHIKRIAGTAGKTFSSLDPDTQASAMSYSAACLAAGAITSGMELIVNGKADNGFALVRPPGHHAEAGRAMGFCLFNNVAVGAHYGLHKLGMERIAIIDWDLHHGNGTQNSFYTSKQVFYISTHAYPYYPGSGGLMETGAGEGEGYTLNVPLSGGQDDRSFCAIFKEIIVPVVREYKPDFIIVSAGFDTYYGDPLGTMAVTEQGFACMAKQLVDLANEICKGRLLVALEGGYNLRGLRDGMIAVLGELSGDSRCPGKVDEETLQDMIDSGKEVAVIEQVRNIAKKYWNL
ncbi:MAG: histone deacetylase [Deltaproteobacteria bacterium]|jgi:acetoin utilization deacetylase AcuC-like enzyme|nr:histone deacetylase [Deltaproteobacteria bacterium]